MPKNERASCRRHSSSTGGLLAASAFIVLTAIAARAQEPAAGGATCTPEEVYAVDAATLEVKDTTVIITAEGTASSAGWKSVALAPRGYSTDGATTTYDLVGCQPQGFAAQVLSPVSAQLTVTIDAAQRTIVIRAKTNSQTLAVADFRK